jgi:hypothetical protein
MFADLKREIASQRSVSLYEDQEEKLKEMFNGDSKGKAPKLIRFGVDLAIEEYENQGV